MEEVMEMVGAVIVERHCCRSLFLFEEHIWIGSTSGSCVFRLRITDTLAESGDESVGLLAFFLSSFVTTGRAVGGRIVLLMLLLLCENEPAVRMR